MAGILPPHLSAARQIDEADVVLALASLLRWSVLVVASAYDYLRYFAPCARSSLGASSRSSAAKPLPARVSLVIKKLKMLGPLLVVGSRGYCALPWQPIHPPITVEVSSPSRPRMFGLRPRMFGLERSLTKRSMPAELGMVGGPGSMTWPLNTCM